MNQPDKITEWFERFLPKGKSQAVFIFTLSCYAIALHALTSGVVSLLKLWPIRTDPDTHVRRAIQPGVDGSTIFDYFLSPVIETLILIGIIELLRRLKVGSIVQVIVSAAGVCALHSITVPIWGILVAPGFLIDAGAYLYWRRVSFWTGAKIVIIIHFCTNLPPFLTVLRRSLHQ